MRACQPKDTKKREGERRRKRDLGPLAPLLYVFPSPWACPYVYRASQECCLFYLFVLTLVLGPFFVLFSQAFPFLVFQSPPFWTPVSYSNYLRNVLEVSCFFKSAPLPSSVLLYRFLNPSIVFPLLPSGFHQPRSSTIYPKLRSPKYK